MKFAAVAFAAILLVGSAAQADVIPPPEPITEVQQAMVGTWQQQGPSGMMGHGEGVETLAFDKERFGSIYMFALNPSAMYQANTRRGTWTGERISATEIKVTLTWEDRADPTVLTFTSIDDRTIEIAKDGRYGMATITYKRVYP